MKHLLLLLAWLLAIQPVTTPEAVNEARANQPGGAGSFSV